MNEDALTTYDIRGTDTTPLTVEYAWNIGKALADWLPTDGRLLVASAASEEQLSGALVEGLRLQGRAVISSAQLDKEQLSVHIVKERLSGGALITYDELQQTATIEIYQHDGQLVTSETGLRDIVSSAESGNFVPAAVKGELTSLA